MNELDNLRPEVRQAINQIGIYVDGKLLGDNLDVIRAELLRLAKECADYARGRKADQDMAVSQLARAEKAEAESADFRRAFAGLSERHRACEAELAALKSQPISGPAQDAIVRFGCGEVLSHEEMCEIVNQAVCAGRELAALKARIAEAPWISFETLDEACEVGLVHGSTNAWRSSVGKRVRLLLED